MSDLRNFFIRVNRKRLDYSIEQLSHEVCTPAYLAKIENNEVKVCEDVYYLLLRNMNIEYTRSKNIEYIYEKIDLFFDYLFSSNLECRRVCRELLLEESAVMYTKAFIYFQIFKLYSQDIVSSRNESDIDLHDFEDYLNDKEKILFDLYKDLYLGEDTVLMSQDNLNRSIVKAKANILCRKGFYLEAYDILQGAYQLACSEVDVIGMGEVLLSLGYVTNFIDVKAMEETYRKSVKLNPDDNVKAWAYFNIGSTLLNQNNVNEAYTYLFEGAKSCKDKSLLNQYNERIFICCCLMGEEDRKHMYIKKLTQSSYHPLFKIMDSNQEYDCHENYIELLKKKKEDNPVLRHLYKINCIRNRRYKEFYIESYFEKEDS